jgi:hypothetical protein
MQLPIVGCGRRILSIVAGARMMAGTAAEPLSFGSVRELIARHQHRRR